MTRRLRLLGDPVSHSLSPRIHRAAFGVWGVDAAYDAHRVSAAELGAAMRGADGGNVTVPHKLAAARQLEEASQDVLATGACNCFWIDSSGRLAGDNTDVGGLRAALRELGAPVRGEWVLLLGAGGAARAAARALLAEGARGIEVRNRTAERARTMVETLDPTRIRVAEGPPVGAYGLVVNATSLGLRAEDPLPLDPAGLECAAAYDMVYAPGGTPWARAARAAGMVAADGLSMLVHQAALSLERWFPGREPPLEAMRAAARAGAGDDGHG